MQNTLKVGDIIEIVQFDGDGCKNLRRVRVHDMARDGRGYTVIGVNMKGQNKIRYRLPLQPADKIVPGHGTTNWFPFEDHGEADE